MNQRVFPHPRTADRNIGRPVIHQEISAPLHESLRKHHSYSGDEIRVIYLRNESVLDLVWLLRRERGGVGHVTDALWPIRLDHAPAHRVHVSLFDRGRSMKR